MKTPEMLFSNSNILFQQRLCPIMQSGIIPQPNYDDFLPILKNDQYNPQSLLNLGIQCLEQSQNLLNAMKTKSSIVSETLIAEDYKQFRRVSFSPEQLFKGYSYEFTCG